MRPRTCCSLCGCVTLLSALLVYFIIKCIYILSQDEYSIPERNIVSNEVVQQPVIPSTTITTVPTMISLIHNSSCKSSFLDEVPEYITSSGCTDDLCKMLTCRNIIVDMDKSVGYFARLWMIKHHVSQSDAVTIKDCADLKTRHNYVNESLEDTSDFPIAFSILVHSNPSQFERLLRSIYRPQNAYCIHVDKKSSITVHEAIKAIADCFDNVFIVSKSEHIIYAGYTRLQADINCMKDLLDHDIKWKYFINIAAQSFPIQTPEEMVRILRIYNGSNDIEGIYGRRILRHRFELEWKENLDIGTVNKTGKRNPRPPDNLDIVRGSAYGIFSRKFVEFILTNQMAINLLNWSRTTFSPDEHYWATLHHLYSNPHLKTPSGFSGVPDSKPWLAVYVKWGLPSKCTGKFVRGVCIFGIGDLKDIVVQKRFFANKFYTDYQPLALDCMEAWIKHKTVCPMPFNYAFYRNLPFVKH